jgi:heptosyltransferase-2
LTVAPDHKSVSRLVVRTPNWLGDAVLALPALTAVRRHFASAHLTIAAVPGVAPLFRERTDVGPDDIIEVSETLREAVAMFQGGGFELGILFPNSFRSAWGMRRAGIPSRWGYPTSVRGWLLTRRSAPERLQGVIHQSDYFRRLVRGLGIPCSDDPPRLRVSRQSVDRADALLTQRGIAPDTTLIAFAPGAAYGEAKQWIPERVAAVAARLVRERGAACVILGASHDRTVARAIESWVRAHAPDALARVIDLVGRTTLGTLAGVTARCRVFVSNDSGAMHLAAALGRPVVAIFGPTKERATGPVGRHEVITAPAFCRPCMLRDCPIDHRCMKRIPVDRVHAAIVTQLAIAPDDQEPGEPPPVSDRRASAGVEQAS